MIGCSMPNSAQSDDIHWIIEQLSTDKAQVSIESTESAEPGLGRRSAQREGGWATIREAVRGSHAEYTDGPVDRAILLLAVPMVLELALESVFAVVDVFFVGRLGPDAVATVGLTESMLTIMYAALAGLSVGATATVARRVGERDFD